MLGRKGGREEGDHVRYREFSSYRNVFTVIGSRIKNNLRLCGNVKNEECRKLELLETKHYFLSYSRSCVSVRERSYFLVISDLQWRGEMVHTDQTDPLPPPGPAGRDVLQSGGGLW